MSYRLRYQQHDLDLTDGQFVIGRAATCQISLDDPMVSRNHAKLTVKGERVTVEDLGSRNGIRVNGQQVTGQRQLSVGDIVGVGSQDLLLLGPRETNTGPAVSRGAETHRLDRFAVIGGLADKALALGRGAEAERILDTLLKDVLDDVREGHGTTSGPQAAAYAVRLAQATNKGAWVNYVLELYQRLGEPLPADVVDELYRVMRRVQGVDVALLRSYLLDLRARSAGLGPADRFLVSRLEGLERLASLR
ncbi:MAG: FHA domain-containing protein [Myxococcales bacterium]|nr:FHA domain-containing protein [Myxococcales bacterium]MCB9577166.1 FHA domain-containing protein [Polyangiaceae bacterium]